MSDYPYVLVFGFTFLTLAAYWVRTKTKSSSASEKTADPGAYRHPALVETDALRERDAALRQAKGYRLATLCSLTLLAGTGGIILIMSQAQVDRRREYRAALEERNAFSARLARISACDVASSCLRKHKKGKSSLVFTIENPRGSDSLTFTLSPDSELAPESAPLPCSTNTLQNEPYLLHLPYPRR